MRRPPLTRNILEGLIASLAHAYGLFWEGHINHEANGNPSKLNKEQRKEYEQHEKASLYVAELNRWHKWKQQQEEQEIIDAVLASIATELANNN